MWVFSVGCHGQSANSVSKVCAVLLPQADIGTHIVVCVTLWAVSNWCPYTKAFTAKGRQGNNLRLQNISVVKYSFLKSEFSIIFQKYKHYSINIKIIVFISYCS